MFPVIFPTTIFILSGCLNTDTVDATEILSPQECLDQALANVDQAQLVCRSIGHKL